MKSWRFIFVLMAFWIFPGNFPQASAQTQKNGKVTLFKEWRFVDGPEEEMVRFGPKVFYTWLGGSGLSPSGISMEKKISEIIPSPTSASGRVIIGPDPTSYRPYWVIHWFDLSEQQVQLAIGKKTYPTSEAAKKEDQLDKSRAKTYRALSWGIY